MRHFRADRKIEDAFRCHDIRRVKKRPFFHIRAWRQRVEKMSVLMLHGYTAQNAKHAQASGHFKMPPPRAVYWAWKNVDDHYRLLFFILFIYISFILFPHTSPRFHLSILHRLPYHAHIDETDAPRHHLLILERDDITRILISPYFILLRHSTKYSKEARPHTRCWDWSIYSLLLRMLIFTTFIVPKVPRGFRP